jgi:hypothetical protein
MLVNFMIKAFTRPLSRVYWPKNFKLPTIRAYDGRTNPIDWLGVY